MVRVYGGMDSHACRKAQSWMMVRGISFNFIDLQSCPIDDSLLDKWLDKFGWRGLIDKRTAAWRHYAPDLQNDPVLPDARSLLRERPEMIKMPIIQAGENWLLGWNEPNKVRLLGQIQYRLRLPEHPGLGHISFNQRE